MFHFPLSLDRATLGSRQNKIAGQILTVEVRTEAVHVMPGVALLPNNKQRLIDFVWARPAG